MPMLRRLATGLTALIILLAALVGIPWLLLRIGGTPSLTGWDRILDTILIQDTTGRLFVTVLIGAAWLAWAGFVLSLLLELLGQARSATVPRLRIIAPQQHLARMLIAAILAMTAAPALHTVTSAPASATGTVTVSAPAAAPDEDAAAAQPTPTADTTTPGTPAAPAGIDITVQAGDNLWDLAEQHLGDGRAWKTIADANYQRTQPDGRHLGPDHVLQPGWTLLIPGAPTTADGSQVLTVHRGDTLSRIAQHRLGHAGDWPQLQRPDHPGANPDQLIPGEHILIPATLAPPVPGPATPPLAPAPTTPRPTATPTATPDASAPSPTATSSRPQPAPATPTTAEAPAATVTDGENPAARTIGHVGLLLASGLIGALALRRRRQHAQRRSGQRIAMPTPAASTTETQLREVHDRDAATDLATALQLIATGAPTPPVLRFAHLTPDRVEVILDEPTHLPDPWTPADTRTCWSIARDQLPPPTPDTTHPYPALVTIGDTDPECHLLIDLETIGSLTVTGEHALDALTALATELAMAETSAGVVHVSLVGFGAELAEALGPEVQHMPTIGPLLTRLEGRAAALARALDDPTMTLPQARLENTVDDAAPHIVFIGQPLPEESTSRLQTLTSRIPRLGVASVALTTAPEQGHYQLLLHGRDATLQPVGIRLTPQLLGGVEYTYVLAMLAASRTPAQPGPAWAHGIDTLPPTALDPLPESAPYGRHLVTVDHEPVRDSQLLDDHPEPGGAEHAPHALTAGSPTIAADTDTVPGTPSTTTDPAQTLATADQGGLAAPSPSEPDHCPKEPSPLDAVASLLGGRASRIDLPIADTSPEPAVPADGPLPPEGHAGDKPQLDPGQLQQMPHHPPLITVLGPLQVLHTQGPEPASERIAGDTTSRTSSHTRMAMITLAYLALKPGRATSAEQLAEQLSLNRRIQARTISQRLSRTRAWLGYAIDGQPYLPIKTRGSAYALHPLVTTDWHELLELIGADITTTPLTDLTAALELVRDRPFIGVPDRDIPWAEELRTEMTQTIADLAHVTASRAMAERNYPVARAAIAKGRRIDDVSQDLWADAIELELLTGHTAKAHDLADELTTWADDADIDLDTHARRAISSAHTRARTA